MRHSRPVPKQGIIQQLTHLSISERTARTVATSASTSTTTRPEPTLPVRVCFCILSPDNKRCFSASVSLWRGGLRGQRRGWDGVRISALLQPCEHQEQFRSCPHLLGSTAAGSSLPQTGPSVRVGLSLRVMVIVPFSRESTSRSPPDDLRCMGIPLPRRETGVPNDDEHVSTTAEWAAAEAASWAALLPAAAVAGMNASAGLRSMQQDAASISRLARPHRTMVRLALNSVSTLHPVVSLCASLCLAPPPASLHPSSGMLPPCTPPVITFLLVPVVSSNYQIDPPLSLSFLQHTCSLTNTRRTLG
jgi:hypothetical protein